MALAERGRRTAKTIPPSASTVWSFGAVPNPRTALCVIDAICRTVSYPLVQCRQTPRRARFRGRPFRRRSVRVYSIDSLPYDLQWATPHPWFVKRTKITSFLSCEDHRMTNRRFSCLTLASGIVPGFVVTLLTVSPGAAGAETIDCKVLRSLPVVISSPGIYCLARNLQTAQATGIAIEVDASDVVVDLNGHTLDGSAAGPATNTDGIASSSGPSARTNVTIKNGTIRGFRNGVQVSHRRAVVEDLTLDRNTFTGVAVSGEGSIVRRNLISRTGGTTAFPDGADGFALRIAGNGNLVEENTISEVVPGLGQIPGSEWGIFVAVSNGCIVRNNVVTDSQPQVNARTFGIAVGGSNNAVVIGNTVTTRHVGLSFESATGVYSQNVVYAPTPVLTGGTASLTSGSGNDLVP